MKGELEMSCSCKDEKIEGRPVAMREGNAPQVLFRAVVRDGGNPLACPRCLEKHLCKALVYADEAQEEDRPVERGLASANLSCAAEHADALGDERAERIASAAEAAPLPETIRSLLPGGGNGREMAIGLLGRAEDELRHSGEPAAADRVREIRISL